MGSLETGFGKNEVNIVNEEEAKIKNLLEQNLNGSFEAASAVKALAGAGYELNSMTDFTPQQKVGGIEKGYYVYKKGEKQPVCEVLISDKGSYFVAKTGGPANNN